jgi:outer membrane protein
MKTKQFITCLLMIFGVLIITLPVYALPFKIEGAIGVWNHDPNGMINYNGDDVELNTDLALSDRNDMNLWFRIEHPVPMLPDLKVQYTPIKVKDNNSTNRPFKFGGYSFDDAIRSEMEMDIIDVQFYNHLPFLQIASLKSLDITYGLNFRFLNGNAFIQEIQTINARTRSFSTPMAMLCAGFRIAPVSRFSLIGDFLATSYSGNHWYDMTAEIQIAPFMEQIFLGIGYRYQDFKIDDVQDVTADQTMQGWFAELGFRFE